MRSALLGLACLLTSAALAQQPMNLKIVGTTNNHEISWYTTPNFIYQLQMSVNLHTWADSGIAEIGNGSTVTYGFSNSGAGALYYRVRAFPDTNKEGFLALPANNDDFMLVEGVRFGFNLNILPSLPSKIRIYARSWNTAAQWKQIGLLTDFASSGSNRFLRGSAIWLPDAPGEYEIKATAIDATGGIAANTVRRITVDPDQLPAFGSLTYNGQGFSTTFLNRNVSEIRRVEFFSGNKVLGSDTEAPFGDFVRDWILNMHGFSGQTTHLVTAKAYDFRGLAGSTPTPTSIATNILDVIPELHNVGLSNSTITQGQSFNITYSVSIPGMFDTVNAVGVGHMYNESDGNVEWIAQASAPFPTISINTSNWEPGTHLLYVIAVDSDGDYSRPVYLTIYVRENAQETFAASLVANVVDTTTTTPSNALYTGIKAATSTFTGGVNAGLPAGMDQGIVLTTGLASLWNAGNNYELTDESYDLSFASRNRREAGDLDIQMHRGVPRTADAAALQFELYCNHGQLEIEYQYGSEEYGESDAANDAFLMTITRPGSPGRTPIAFLPDGSGIPGIDTINITNRRHLYRDADIDILPSVAPADQPNRVEYDGMTIKMRAHVFISPGATYKVKFIIADGIDISQSVNDSADSALFIRKASVRTVEPLP